MQLTIEETEMLNGVQGWATQKAMQILVALGDIYGAERMIQVTSVQIARVSYDNLGEGGLQSLAEMADRVGKVRVLTTLNPAGMDIENWHTLGIQPDFAEKQLRVLEAFSRMGVTTTCTCSLTSRETFLSTPSTWPGLKARRSALPTLVWVHAPTAREVPPPWPPPSPGAPLNMAFTAWKIAVRP